MTLRLYKAADVCQAAGLQSYVLRSWEKEFPGIGVQKSPESPRLYREADIEQVLRIKQLVFGEGLTLSGARRRIEEAMPARVDRADADVAEVLDTLGADARTRIAFVRDGLRSMLHVLSKNAGAATLATLPFGDPPPREARPGDRKPDARPAARPDHRQVASRQTAASKEKRGATKRSATPKRAAATHKASNGKRKRVVQRF